MKPMVSILIPAFNAQDWITDTIKSALAQTWERKEIIIVDDGSTDRTLSIARQFESKAVLILSHKNQGAAATRNKAFSVSQGDYIQWLDADDLLGPHKISKQMEASEQCPNKRMLLSSAWGRFIYRLSRAEFTPTPLWCDLSRAEWLLRKMEQNLHMQTATWLVSREVSEAAGPWNTRLLGDDDGEYFCRVLMASEGTRFVPEAKVYYRMAGSGSLSYIGLSERKMEAQFASMKLHIEYLQSLENSERVRVACVRYLQNWLLNFYPNRLDIVEQAQQLAGTLGGRLEVPRLSWKYAWIQKAFGWKLAKRTQVFIPRIKWSVISSWDKALARVEQHDLRAKEV